VDSLLPNYRVTVNGMEGAVYDAAAAADGLGLFPSLKRQLEARKQEREGCSMNELLEGAGGVDTDDTEEEYLEGEGEEAAAGGSRRRSRKRSDGRGGAGTGLTELQSVPDILSRGIANAAAPSSSSARLNQVRVGVGAAQHQLREEEQQGQQSNGCAGSGSASESDGEDDREEDGGAADSLDGSIMSIMELGLEPATRAANSAEGGGSAGAEGVS
jgi:hypothetical protein